MALRLVQEDRTDPIYCKYCHHIVSRKEAQICDGAHCACARYEAQRTDADRQEESRQIIQNIYAQCGYRIKTAKMMCSRCGAENEYRYYEHANGATEVITGRCRYCATKWDGVDEKAIPRTVYPTPKWKRMQNGITTLLIIGFIIGIGSFAVLPDAEGQTLWSGIYLNGTICAILAYLALRNARELRKKFGVDTRRTIKICWGLMLLPFLALAAYFPIQAIRANEEAARKREQSQPKYVKQEIDYSLTFEFVDTRIRTASGAEDRYTDAQREWFRDFCIGKRIFWQGVVVCARRASDGAYVAHLRCARVRYKKNWQNQLEPDPALESQIDTALILSQQQAVSLRKNSTIWFSGYITDIRPSNGWSWLFSPTPCYMVEGVGIQQ